MPTGTGDGETADAAQKLSAAQSKVEIRKLELQAEVEKEKIQLEREKLQCEAEERNLRSEREAEKERREAELKLEKERMEAEKERKDAELKLKMMELEVEKLKLENKNNASAVPCRVKLQPYDHASGEDIISYLAEFEALSSQAGWTLEMKMLQLRSLLTGEAREVSAQAHKSYEDLSKALIERYGKKPYQYFKMLLDVQKHQKETYRGLMARVKQYVIRFIDDSEDVLGKIEEEFFLSALPVSQAQWIRRNKGSGTVVDAAEDYIFPERSTTKTKTQVSQASVETSKTESKKNFSDEPMKNVRCYNCNKMGHIAKKCPKANKNNIINLLVNSHSDGLVHLPGEVNGKDISFVKDTGAVMTLIREDLVDPRYVLEGQRQTLYTAIGQPFSAKLAVVDMETPFYKGHAQVGLVPDLAAEALLGMDIMERKTINVVTRGQKRQQDKEDAEASQKVTMETKGNSEVAENHNVRESELNSQANDSDANKDTEDSESIATTNDESEVIIEEKNYTKDISKINVETLREMQISDVSLANLRRKAADSSEEVDSDSNAIFWENGVLKRKWKATDGVRSGVQVILPVDLRNQVIELAHKRALAGHLGVEKTKERILTSFYWPGVFKDVTQYCRTCDVCQKVAKRRCDEKAPLVQPPIVGEPFFKISMDVVGPLSKSKRGNRFILTVMDDATRYPEAFALRNVDAATVADTLIEMFSRVGFPQVILTDQGSNFTSVLLNNLYEITGIRGITTSPYHPQANGKVERFNATLKAILKKLSTSNKEEWDTLLPYALFAYREVPHEETGFSPFEMLYGWPVRGPIQILEKAMTGEDEIQRTVVDHVVNMRERLSEIRDTVRETLVIKRQKIKQWYDQNATNREFRPGDEVLLLLPSDSSKMVAQWKGPYRVIRKVTDVNYEISVGGRRGRVIYHVNLLRKYNRSVPQIGFVQRQPDVNPAEDVGDNVDEITDVKLGANLNKTQRKELRRLCEDFLDVINSEPGKTTLVTHTIKTTNKKPIRQQPYRIPQSKRGEVKRIIDEMLEKGQISPSSSPYSAPVVLVEKPDKSIRLCVDYRKLNDITEFDGYPIPRIDEIFEKLGKAKYLSTMDLAKGYWQIPLAEESQEKSAFVTEFGQFKFHVMPFGMKTAPATFARMMDKMLRGLSNVVAYFDDIVVFTETWEDHKTQLRNVLQRLREDGLTVKPSKCILGEEELYCLGHVVGHGSVKPDDRKIKVMTDFPLPQSKKGVRSFLGMTGYYRKFVKDYARIAEPLTDMLKSKEPTKVVWTENRVNAFRALKDAMTQAPVLINPDFEKHFYLQTDASNTAIGGVLSQKVDGDEHPVAYTSRKLLPREINYSTVEKECLAIVWSIETFGYYLNGVQFTVETDHNPLVWLEKTKLKNQRLMRWALALQPYCFDINYRKGSNNANADGLSRIE
ncbi:uncharacterized protein LOC132554744 [Ylistrum balloti]|uniref:uncharacterized protein LOC132554744 n=1 Tax=Ylistrum balloti TaxID=509963 RepID=UPI002905AF9C|nr:uncharacterized protein LOC132554744 [Ylistrum balloti]